MTIERDLEIPQGSQIRIRFTLTIRGVAGGWPVSGATDIRMTLAASDGTILDPVLADPADPAANWASGIVPVLLPASVTEDPTTVKYALVVTIGDEVVIPVTGTLYIRATPGF